jgi:uncharacterized RmlC-like cupin family protein
MKPEGAGIVVGPDDGEVIVNPLGGLMSVKARDTDTGGAYCIYDNTIPAGSPGPRPHLHRNHDEAFYVLSGELTLRIGSRTVTGRAGSFLMVPRGIVHQPSNQSSEPVHVLLIFSPEGMDHFFEEAAKRKLPLQSVPTEESVLQQVTEFTESYGYDSRTFPRSPEARAIDESINAAHRNGPSTWDGPSALTRFGSASVVQ